MCVARMGVRNEIAAFRNNVTNDNNRKLLHKNAVFAQNIISPASHNSRRDVAASICMAGKKDGDNDSAMQAHRMNRLFLLVAFLWRLASQPTFSLS